MTLTPEQTERLFRDLGEIKGSLLSLKEKSEEGDEVHQDHDERLRTLETSSAKRIGYVAGAAAASSAGITTVMNLFF